MSTKHVEGYALVIGGASIDITFKENEEGGYSSDPTVVSPGGKGANQAVAAARAGYRVKMISVVGDDEIGYKTVKNLENNGVDCSYGSVEKNGRVKYKNVSSICVYSGHHCINSSTVITHCAC